MSEMIIMNDKKLTDYLDKNFDKLINKYDELAPSKFFSEKWEDSEEVPIYNRYNHISFLDRFSEVNKDLFLLNYSLMHLNDLIGFFCKNSNNKEIENALIMLTISDWDLYPPERMLSFSFFITYRCHTLFSPPKPFSCPYTRQSFYIKKLLEELNIIDNYFVFDDSPPIDEKLQRVYVGLKKHPDPNLITLDNFVADIK